MTAALALTSALIALVAARWATVLVRPRSPIPERPRRPRGGCPTTDTLATYLDALAREVRSGRHLAAALADLPKPQLGARGGDNPDRAIVEHTIAASLRLGGAVAPALDAAAAVLRERSASAAEAAAHSAQARLSALVLTLVPVGFAMFGIIASQRTRAAYVHSSIGLACATVGMALNVTGWWWMRRIVRSAA